MKKEFILSDGKYVIDKLMENLDQSYMIEFLLENKLLDKHFKANLNKVFSDQRYIELIWYKGRENQTILMLERFNKDFYRVRRLTKYDTCYQMPKECKHQIIMRRCNEDVSI